MHRPHDIRLSSGGIARTLPGRELDRVMAVVRQKATNRAYGKLTLSGGRVSLAGGMVAALLKGILQAKGCAPGIAAEVAEHLMDTELCGVESHGVMRILQYAEQYESGYLKPHAVPSLKRDPMGQWGVDGGGGTGIPVMRFGVRHCCAQATEQGIAVLPVRNLGHTGRLGAFAEEGALQGLFVMIIGGGGRQAWRQVAPFGGRKAILPTNPWCFGMPGGAHGPVIVDFATSALAGGWLHAARAAGALVPEDAIIDADGKPSRDPAAYFNGGAILPKGGAMGYGLGLMAELLCEAMLGPVTTEVNWLILALDTKRYRSPNAIRDMAEGILAELRACPPAPGFDGVEIPGERERLRRAANPEKRLYLPEATWRAISNLAQGLAVNINEAR